MHLSLFLIADTANVTAEGKLNVAGEFNSIFAEQLPAVCVSAVDGQEITRIRPGGEPRRFVGDELVLLEEPREGRKAFAYVRRRIGGPGARPVACVDGDGAWDVDLARGRLFFGRDRALSSRPLSVDAGRPRSGSESTRAGSAGSTSTTRPAG